jgi:hypothetical protein
MAAFTRTQARAREGRRHFDPWIFPGANYVIRDAFDQAGPIQWSRNAARQVVRVRRDVGLAGVFSDGEEMHNIRRGVALSNLFAPTPLRRRAVHSLFLNQKANRS